MILYVFSSCQLIIYRYFSIPRCITPDHRWCKNVCMYVRIYIYIYVYTSHSAVVCFVVRKCAEGLHRHHVLSSAVVCIFFTKIPCSIHFHVSVHNQLQVWSRSVMCHVNVGYVMVVPCQVGLGHAMLCYAMSCNVMSCLVMLCYSMLCCVMLLYVVLG